MGRRQKERSDEYWERKMQKMQNLKMVQRMELVESVMGCSAQALIQESPLQSSRSSSSSSLSSVGRRMEEARQRGEYTGTAEDYEGWERKVRMVRGLLEGLAVSRTFETSSLEVGHFTVSPIVVPSPRAAQRSFSISAHQQEHERVEEIRKADHGEEDVIELSSDEEEDQVPSPTSPPTIPSPISPSTTMLYERLKSAKDTEIRAWILKEQRTKLEAEGWMFPPSPALPPLPPTAVQSVRQAWRQAGRSSAVLAEAGDIPLTGADLGRFQGTTWLNDECINGYLQLVQARSQGTVHAFNTYFYARLDKEGYGAVQRWTRRFDLFSKHLILIPIHLGMHWTIACIDFSKRQIFYIDSFHAGNDHCLRTLHAYLHQEHQDKRGTAWDSAGWSSACLREGVPRQMNGYDCGVFACVFGEHLARGVPFDFSQNDMPYFRHRLPYELLTGTLLT